MADSRESRSLFDDFLYKFDIAATAFSDISSIPVTVYGADGHIISEYRPELKPCSMLSIYKLKNGGCRKQLSFAGEFSSHLGEPYIFLCRAGLSNISVPIIIKGEFNGFAVAGPFIMKKLRPSTINTMLAMNRLTDSEKSMTRKFAEDMKVFSSPEATQLSVLFFSTVLSSLLPSGDYTLLSERSEDQRTISSKIRAAKNESLLVSTFSPETEKELASCIVRGDLEEADRMIRKIMDNFSIISVGNLDEIKTLSLWATASIVKSISGEVSLRSQEAPGFDIDIDIINSITEAQTLEQLVHIVMHIANLASDMLKSMYYTGSSQLISHALKYIRDNYSKKITLKSICRELHVNTSYFSYLFSHEMGQSFVEYLTGLRLEKAAVLLSGTDMSVLDISSSCGFESQSYFSKVFKARNGMTPMKYRKAHLPM